MFINNKTQHTKIAWRSVSWERLEPVDNFVLRSNSSKVTLYLRLGLCQPRDDIASLGDEPNYLVIEQESQRLTG